MRVQAFKFALDPTQKQEEQFNSHAGAAVFCFNRVLEHAQSSYEIGLKFSPNHQNLRGVWYKNRDKWAVNRETGEVWWSENSKQVYDMACKNAAQSYSNFFKSLKGERRGKSGFPRRKRKGGRRSFQFSEQVKLIGFHHIQLPRIGKVKTHESLRKLIAVNPVKIGTTTISQNTSGRWVCSMVVHVEDENCIPPEGPTVGIDLGLKILAVVADKDGNVLVEEPNNKYLRSVAVKLKRAQKALARSQRNSNRRTKKKQKVGKLHNRVANLRRDQINKFTAKVAERFPVVVIEDLAIKNMVKNRRLSKSILDAGWGEIRRQLCYKVDTLIIVDRFFASSKTCSDCGAVKAKLLLTERTYCCSQCGSISDRDINAARNLALVGSNLSEKAVGYTVTGRGHSVRRGLVPAVVGEASRLIDKSTLDSNAQISNQMDMSNNVQ